MGAKPMDRYKALCAVVIDTGTGHTRSGLAGDEQPRSVVPSQAGGSPVLTHGVVTNWDGLEELWHRILYQELGVCPEEVAVLATDGPLSPIANREKMAELLFEGFGVPAMLVLPRSLLAAYSYGRTTGVVVGSGAGTSYTAGVREGYALPHATFRLDVAGDALTLYLGQLLESRGVHLDTDPLCRLKETCCCVLPGAGRPQPVTPPGTSTLLQGDERFRCPEVLLAPTTLGLPEPGLLEQASHSLRRCGGPPGGPAPCLLLAGGTTLLRGLPQRLAEELGVSTEAAPRRRAAAWLGGSLAASLDAFQGAWVPRDVYGEGGPATVHPHCC
ncbi:actin-like [Strigops habroptila]|uniref:Actin-like n=1 Tax=Strigops habroptila TaxID=2489341 RepID=A0A672UZ62_STRHB|nr:actin-like [Strigops habroptila]